MNPSLSGGRTSKSSANAAIPATLSSVAASKWQLTIPVTSAYLVSKLPAITREEALAQFLVLMANDEEEIATY